MLSISAGVAQDFEVGIRAAQAGDFDTALRELRPLAKQGHAGAQYNLGVMYLHGKGVSQDYAAALKWYRLAAEQGHAIAQYALGFMYDNGNGVLQDYVEALKWFHLAADR